MRLIVGLGNPGERYARTRHNVGHQALDRAAVRWKVAFKPRRGARLGHGQIGPSDARQGVALAAPLAWMNQAGPAVKVLLEELALSAQDLIVVHDDLDLPLGRLRIKRRGGSGGHNGILSIISALETEAFCRLKLGIGRPGSGVEPADYVLSPFSPEEALRLDTVLDHTVQALECLVVEGIAVAMNRFNKELIAES